MERLVTTYWFSAEPNRCMLAGSAIIGSRLVPAKFFLLLNHVILAFPLDHQLSSSSMYQPTTSNS
jgi:hypothetical protein